MFCPHCQVDVHERWIELHTAHDALGDDLKLLQHEIPNKMAPQKDEEGDDTEQEHKLTLSWMECPRCNKIIVRVDHRFYDNLDEDSDSEGLLWSDAWIAFPKSASTRAVDPLVPENLASKYREAAAILEMSPSASAAIARRILYDVLEDYGGYEHFQLSKKIEEFAENERYPAEIRDNVKYLTQIGDFATHTQKDKETSQIVDVEPGEAEWTLEIIDELFDLFVVTPEHNKERRRNLDEKLARTGRKPIKRAAPDGDQDAKIKE